MKTEADWTEAGRRVFQEFDSELLRTFDPQFIALVLDPKRLDELATDALPDGTLNGLRWVPTKLGVALTFPSCSGCHTAFQQDGSPIPGAPLAGLRRMRVSGFIAQVHYANGVPNAHSPFLVAGDFGMRL